MGSALRTGLRYKKKIQTGFFQQPSHIQMMLLLQYFTNKCPEALSGQVVREHVPCWYSMSLKR